MAHVTTYKELVGACKEALEVMQEEKDRWDGACDLFDKAIEVCQQAIDQAKKERTR